MPTKKISHLCCSFASVIDLFAEKLILEDLRLYKFDKPTNRFVESVYILNKLFPNYPFHFQLDIRETTRAFKTTIKVYVAENLNYGKQNVACHIQSLQ